MRQVAGSFATSCRTFAPVLIPAYAKNETNIRWYLVFLVAAYGGWLFFADQGRLGGLLKMQIVEGKETGVPNLPEIRGLLHKIEAAEDELMELIKGVKIF